jgi:hypothetical protein
MIYPHHAVLIETLNSHGRIFGYNVSIIQGDIRIDGRIKGFVSDNYCVRTEGGVEIIYIYRPEDPDASDKPKYSPIQLTTPLTIAQRTFLLTAIERLLLLPVERVMMGFDEDDWVVDYPGIGDETD